MALLVPSFVCCSFFCLFLLWWKQGKFFWKYASNLYSDLPGQEPRGQRNGCHLRLIYANRIIPVERNFKPMRMSREALLTFSPSMIVMGKVMVKLIHFSICFKNRLK